MQSAHAGQATTRGGGTEGWQSPEAMLNDGATQASDVFSLGLIFFFVLSGGEHPFGEAGVMRTRAMMRFATTDVEEGEEVEDADAKVKRRVASALSASGGPASSEDAELVAEMLRLVPGRRPSAEAVLASAVLSETAAAAELVRECVVCLDAEPTFAVLPCGHRCLCAGCRGAAAQACPLCRKPTDGTVRIFEA